MLAELHKSLSGMGLGNIYYYPQIGSTNDEALVLATTNIPDFSLVFADEQTAGRGRGGRKWFTPPNSALAFSLILRPNPNELEKISLFSGLGALALCDACTDKSIHAQIKWPNDILINGKKVGGILVETTWLGNKIEKIILGMGVNMNRAAVPPEEDLHFPATSLESEGFQNLDRQTFLKKILVALINRRKQIGSSIFSEEWQERLAFKDQLVKIWRENETAQAGWLRGLNPDGSLIFEGEDGIKSNIHFGEVHLRPL